MRNFKMVVQYDGSRYKGWQKLNDNDLTIQGKIETVLIKMVEEDIQLIGCGRTDAGVHAENYVANFHTNSKLSGNDMLNYMYEYLPEDILVKSLEEVQDRFHARHNVKSKTYGYTISNRRFRNVFDRKYIFHSEDKLDVTQMKNAAEMLVGTHDFQSFTSLKPGLKSTTRTINSIEITSTDKIIKIDINGDGFLLHMARIIVGTLLEVARYNLKLTDVQKILDNRKRAENCPMAQPKGLCLKEVIY